MTDDRDRRAARDYLDRFTEEPMWDVYSPDAEQALAALLTAARAEGAAEAISECESAARDVIAECAEEDYVAWDTLESVLVERIRALAPAGLVAVDPADLEMALPLAEGGPADYQQPSAWRDAHRRLRAAVARKEG